MIARLRNAEHSLQNVQIELGEPPRFGHYNAPPHFLGGPPGEARPRAAGAEPDGIGAGMANMLE